MRVAAIAVAGAMLVAGCSATSSGRGAVAAPARHSAPPSTAAHDPAPAASAAAKPARTPCTGNARPRWVFVSLRRQHLWLCARSRVVRDSPITSGMLGQYTETPTGNYRIQGLNRDTTLTLNTGATYPVRYWIPFDAPLFGFHDSSWQDFPYGSARYKTAGSHGCVHVPLAVIRFLYRWADIGTPVRIKA